MVESVFDHGITATEAVSIGMAGSELEWVSEREPGHRMCVEYTDDANAFFREIADLLELRGEVDRAAWYRERQLPPIMDLL